ncbi:MAG: RNA 2',3'-cyclic phosphodiesterase [Nanoarchaeota archaeon]|nr:RNA 2',3'-cyclic phosphodiesterase [Nanoarchaeota archaeon]
MRLFIAFDVSKEAHEELLRIQKGIEHAKINPVRKFHLTLKFLGEVSEDNAEKINEKLRKIKFKGFDAELGVVGVFPSEDYIKVIWVGLKPEDKIIMLQQKIEEALSGFFPKDIRFHPHITLARVRSVEDKTLLRECLKGLVPDKIRFKVGSFKLIKSELRPGGPVYEFLEEYGLK